MNFAMDEMEPNPEIIGSVLESATRYFCELNQTFASHAINGAIEVEFYKLVSPTIHHPGLPLAMLEQLLPIGPIIK